MNSNWSITASAISQTFYKNVIKHSGHLRTLEKCRKLVLKCTSCLSQCNTRLRLYWLFTLHVVSKTQIRCDIRAQYNTHPDNKWTRNVASHLFFAGIEVNCKQLQSVLYSPFSISPLVGNGTKINIVFEWKSPNSDCFAKNCEIFFFLSVLAKVFHHHIWHTHKTAKTKYAKLAGRQGRSSFNNTS